MNIARKIGQIFAVLISILIFVAILALMLITTSKSLITKDNLASYIKDANVLNMDANAIFDFGSEGTLKEKIGSIALETGIPQEIVEDILRSNEINELLGDYFSEIIDYTFNENKPVLAKETVEKITNVALVSLNRHINTMMEEEQLKTLVVDFSQRLSNLIPNKTEIVNEKTLSYVRQITGFHTAWIYIGIAVLVILTGILTVSTYKPFKCLGIAMLVAGIVFVILGSSDAYLNGFITSRVSSMEAVIGPLVTNILTLWFKCGVVVSFVGLLLIIIYMMIRRMVLHTRRYG